MSDYTPTVEAFRGVYGRMCAEWCRDDALAEFDRLIARIKAEAWDEGAQAGSADARAVNPGYPAPTPNPYREETGL